MRVSRFALISALLLVFLSSALFPQAKPQDELRKLNDELVKNYNEKNWPGTLQILQRQLEVADRIGDHDLRAGILYNVACVHSVAGNKREAVAAIRKAVAAGYTDYLKYQADSDFDSLRGDSGFRAVMMEIKAKYGPHPLAWDTTAEAPEFKPVPESRENPQLADMRREFSIDAVVEGARDDYDRLRRLTAWTSTRWKHSPNQMASRPDAVTILREAAGGGRFICRDYAIVLAAVANAYGMPARVLNLLPREVETRSEAHSVAEVWLRQYRKWVMADGQYGAIGELGGTPLSGIELQAAFAADKPVRCNPAAGVCAEWKPFVLRNAYYFKIADDQRSFERRPDRQLVLVPKGAPEPHKFAGGNEEVFSGAIYTSNPKTFYAPPVNEP